MPLMPEGLNETALLHFLNLPSEFAALTHSLKYSLSVLLVVFAFGVNFYMKSDQSLELVIL
jgi:uncharacterized membrane protein